jgi:intergrase/recombinase
MLALERPLKLSYSRVQETIAKSGVKVKYIRNWVYNKMLALEIPEGVTEFIVGHKASSIGRRHYLNALVQADLYYKKYVEYLRTLSIPGEYDKAP